MKNLPQILTTSILAKLAADDETHFVRVLLLRVNNTGVFRHRCKRRQYLFEKVGSAGGHVIDIPLSLWMDGIPTAGVYRENPSICHDLQPTVAAPLVIQILAYASAPAKELETSEDGDPPADLTPILSDLLTKLGAPEIMHEAVDLLKAGDEESFRNFVDSVEVKAKADDTEPEEVEQETAPVEKAEDTKPAEQTSESAPAEPAPDASEATKAPSEAALRQKAYRERKKKEKAEKAAAAKAAGQQ